MNGVGDMGKLSDPALLCFNNDPFAFRYLVLGGRIRMDLDAWMGSLLSERVDPSVG